MKVSVLMPAFQAAPWIAEAVASVLAQDHPDFELLVGDDGSTDGTPDLVPRHPRVRLFRSAENRGAGPTRNRLLGEARGDYVALCDADDLMFPGVLSRFSGILDAEPEVGVVCGAVLEVDGDAPPRLLERDPARFWDLRECPVNNPGAMVRRQLVLDVGGWSDLRTGVEDWCLWLRLAEVTRFRYAHGEIACVWRRHAASLTRSTPSERVQQDIEGIVGKAIRRRYDRELRGAGHG